MDASQPDLQRLVCGVRSLPPLPAETSRLAAAIAAERLADRAPVRLPPEAFAASLLHDVGELVLGRFLSPVQAEVLRRQRDVRGRSWLEAEGEGLGMTHADLSGLVVRHLALPPGIERGVRAHHDVPGAPGGEAADLVAALVRLADAVADAEDAGGPDPAPLATDLAALRLSAAVLAPCTQEVRDGLPAALAMYGSGAAAA